MVSGYRSNLTLPVTIKKLVLCVAWYYYLAHLCAVNGEKPFKNRRRH